jgi:hypothetical protein
MVLLTGGSSVGKTRALFEAVRAVLPEWWLLHPANAAAVRALHESPTPRTVVWLDDLQRYLDQPGGVPAGLVRGLLTEGIVVVGTVWSAEYTARSAPYVPGRNDLHAEDRELLRLAQLIDVPGIFTTDERRRAKRLVADRRIRIALDSEQVGVTQVLAAGPELVRRWENAPDGQCYGKAVITAALDARRVGAHAPLSAGFLTDAAPAYLSSAEQATAPADWFDRAIRYATEAVHGAAACLTPAAAGMGQVAGYVTADYLHQHARTVRATTAVAVPVWQALVTHHHPDDTMRLADNADHHNVPEPRSTDVVGADASRSFRCSVIR